MASRNTLKRWGRECHYHVCAATAAEVHRCQTDLPGQQTSLRWVRSNTIPCPANFWADGATVHLRDSADCLKATTTQSSTCRNRLRAVQHKHLKTPICQTPGSRARIPGGTSR